MIRLFRRKKEYICDSLFFTHCCYCNKRIIVEIPEKYERYKVHGALSCNDCVSDDSMARNDIEESSFTDISKKLWMD